MLSDQVPLLERRARDLGTLAKQEYHSEAQQVKARQQLVDAQAKYAQAQRQLKQAEQTLADATERQNQMNVAGTQAIASAWPRRGWNAIESSLRWRSKARPRSALSFALRSRDRRRAEDHARRRDRPSRRADRRHRPQVDARKIELEVDVPSADIGGIKPGARAVVKLAAFDWTRYGTLAGTVREVPEKPVGDSAPAAASSGAAAPSSYFPVMVTLEKNYVGEDARTALSAAA